MTRSRCCVCFVSVGSMGLAWQSVVVPSTCTLGELLLRAARFSPDGQILRINAGTKGVDVLSYSSLLEDARRIAGGLRASGCRPGSLVVLLLDRPFDFVPAFWGCVFGGYIPCPLAPWSMNIIPVRWSSPTCDTRLCTATSRRIYAIRT
jgi:acyl-CoA synthetase (AMP-forming)/AMP-acid ligase II